MRSMMFSRPWSLAQYAVALVVAVIGVVSLIGTFTLNNVQYSPELATGIETFVVFPALVVSLVLNATLMRVSRAPAPNVLQIVLLIVEFLLIAVMLVLHVQNGGDAIGISVALWPVVIVV